MASGFSFETKSTKCLRLFFKLSVEKLFLPIDVPMLPSLSCFISTKPDLISPTDINCRSGTLIIHFGDSQDRILQILRNNNIYFDVRTKGIRLSPHVYNSGEQIDFLKSLNIEAELSVDKLSKKTISKLI